MNSLDDFQWWVQRFRTHLGVVEPDSQKKFNTPRPHLNVDGLGDVDKHVDQLSPAEKKKYDLDVKTYSALTMALQDNIFHQFSHIKHLALLYTALKARSLGNAKERNKSMLMSNETVGEMLIRYYHMLVELNRYELHRDEADRVDTLKDSLPSSYSTYVMVLTKNGYFKTLNLKCMDLVRKL